jgi:hypothetical protein
MVPYLQVDTRVLGLAFALTLGCTPEVGPIAEDDGSSGSPSDTSTSTSTTSTTQMDSSETDEATGTGDTDTGDTETGETGDLVCHDESSDIEVPGPFDCQLAPPCPDVVFPYKAFECDQPDYDAMAAACVIEALRAGTPGFHRLRDCGGSKYNIETRLQVFDDATVLWYQQRNTCAEPSSYRETWRTLPDPAYFDACDITTGAGFGACIEGILDQPCVLGEPSCP